MGQLTERQEEVAALYDKLQSQYEVAKELGITRAGVQTILNRARAKGWVPIKKQRADAGKNGARLIGSSTLYNAEGEVILNWEKTVPQAQLFEEFVEKLCDGVIPRQELPLQRWSSDDDLVAEICAYDLHMGMYAHGAETGDADYDTKIAGTRFMAAIKGFAQRLNYPSTVRLILGGDTLHADNNTHQTPASGHVLDVDTRHSLVIGKLVAACRDAVELLSMMTETVEIYVIQGNHDPISSIWLSEVLKTYYEKCDRVVVCDQKTIRKYAVWGKCLSVYGHGDKIKADKWPNIVAAEQPVFWGQTKYRYARLGHIHTKKTIAPIVVDEKAGLEVTYLSSLAAADAWHSHSGYVGNQRGMQAFELHKELGQVSQFYSNV